jgi:hypothetical protein
MEANMVLVRKLRIGDEQASEKSDEKEILFEKNRVLRIDFDPKVGDKIDRLYKAQEELDVISRDYKRRVKPLEATVSMLKQEILEYAETEQVTTVRGRTATLEYLPKTSREIAPVKFLKFLKDLGKGNKFWDYTKINITDPIKDFGENVLESVGVLETKSNPYGIAKVRPREG